jgi:hypothetical protein
MDFITVSEMEKILGLKKDTVKHRLYYAKIAPIESEAIYPLAALETIKRMTKRGRGRVETPSPGALYAREYRARKKAAAASGQAFADKRRKEGGAPVKTQD